MNNLDNKKTYKEHKEYLFEIVKLQLWFVWNWKKKHPEEELLSILRNRVDIYRKTDINKGLMNPENTDFDNSEWLDIENRLKSEYIKCCNVQSAENFEKNGFEIVKTTIEARSRRDYEERPYVLDYKCGTLTYDPPETDTPKLIFFHIANAIQPKSIFDDEEYLPNCLMDVIEKASKEFPDTLGLHTMTWLNSNPKWRKLFPAIWFRNMEVRPDIQWHFSYWGQFITAKGTFNEKLGKQFRKTGRFPFDACYSWCTYDELRNHLKKPCNP